MGDFIYIDFDSPIPYEHLLADAFGQCIGRAMNLGCKLHAKNSNEDFKLALKLQREYQFGGQQAQSDVSGPFGFYIDKKGNSVWGPVKPTIDVDMIPEFVDGYQDDFKEEVEKPEEDASANIELSVNIAKDDDE